MATRLVANPVVSFRLMPLAACSPAMIEDSDSLNGACSSKMRVICEERSSISPVYTPKSAWQEWKQRRRSPVRDITDGVVIGETVGFDDDEWQIQ